MKPSTEDLIAKVIAYGTAMVILVVAWPTIVAALAMVGLGFIVAKAMEKQ